MRLIILFCLLFGVSSVLSAQLKPTSDMEKFSDHLWYGGSFTLGFSSGTGTSLFQFGVAPMVGYKLTPILSAGPRISLLYSMYSSRLFGNRVERVQPITWAIGAFSRVKFLAEIFGHVEFEYANQGLAFIGSSGLEVARQTRNNIYLGAGYSSGRGQTKYEILGLYNFNQPIDLVESPFSIRFGFTYNF